MIKELLQQADEFLKHELTADTDMLKSPMEDAKGIIKALADELRGRRLNTGMKYGKAYRNALMVGNIVTNLKEGQKFAYISRDLTVTMEAKSTLGGWDKGE